VAYLSWLPSSYAASRDMPVNRKRKRVIMDCSVKEMEKLSLLKLSMLSKIENGFSLLEEPNY
jgi:hypothetical protein